MDAMLVLMFLQLLLLYIGTGDTVRCFECKDVPSPIVCSDITTCEKGESCYLEQRITSSGNVVYSSGCETNSRCASFRGRRAISRRSSGIVTCRECCDGMYCNNRGCGVQEIVRPDRGVYCFNCPYLADPAVCNSVSICATTKKCITHVRDEFEGLRDQTIYHSECMHKPSCRAFEVLGKGQCCDDDFCNDYFHKSAVNITIGKSTTATTNEHVYRATNAKADEHTRVSSTGLSNELPTLPIHPATVEPTDSVASITTGEFTITPTNEPKNATTGEVIMPFTNNTSSKASSNPNTEKPTKSATNEPINVSRNVFTRVSKTLSTNEFTVPATDATIITFTNENMNEPSKDPTKTNTEASAISTTNKFASTTAGVVTLAYTEESTKEPIKLITDTPRHTLTSTTKEAFTIASTNDPTEATTNVADVTDAHKQASTSEPNNIQTKVTDASTHSPMTEPAVTTATNEPTVTTANKTTDIPTDSSTSESANSSRNTVSTDSPRNTADGALVSASTNEPGKSTTNAFSDKPPNASTNDITRSPPYTSTEAPTKLYLNKTTYTPTFTSQTTPTSEVSSMNPHASGRQCDTSGGYHRLTLSNGEQFCIKVSEHDRRDWARARIQCELDHARLVVTDTDEKIRLTETLLRTGYFYMYWIGLWDRDSNDQFYWVNGVRLTDSDWGTDPPQPSLVSKGRDEDCVYIYNQDHWLDTWCDQTLWYICERT